MDTEFLISNEYACHIQVTILQNVYWKETGLLVFVWLAFLALQIAKVICSFLTCTVEQFIQCSISNLRPISSIVNRIIQLIVQQRTGS